MTTYELETGTIGFIEVEREANLVEINISGDVIKYSLNGIPYFIDLYDGFKPLSLFSQLKEEDVKEVMPKLWNGYINFINKYKSVGNYKRYVCETAIEAIHSLAQHLGLNAVNPYDAKPINFITGDLGVDDAEWQQAQSKVKQYFVVFKAKK